MSQIFYHCATDTSQMNHYINFIKKGISQHRFVLMLLKFLFNRSVPPSRSSKRYKVMKKIGEGSYGDVYKCLDLVDTL